MKRFQLYLEKITRLARLWKDYIPIINMALFGIVIILTVVMISLALLPVPDLKPGKFEETEPGKMDIEPVLISQKTEHSDPDEFDLIENNNLFNPSRTEWETASSLPPPPPLTPEIVEEKVVQQEKPRPKINPNQIKLSAIVLFGDTKAALIENIDKSKSNDTYIYVKEGEDIAGYTVKSIERDKLVVEWNGEESVISMYQL